jgi:hypothetical protein
VVVSVGLYEGKGTEALDYCGGCLWAGESLKEFLEDQACRDNHVRTGQRLNQGNYFGLVNGSIAPKSEGPDTRVDKEAHFRDRSAL